MIGDTLFLSTPYNRVVALDAKTGRELWSYDPQAYRWPASRRTAPGFVHRGVATWTDGKQRRIFISEPLAISSRSTRRPANRFRRSATTATSISRASILWSVRADKHYTKTSPPVVWRRSRDRRQRCRRPARLQARSAGRHPGVRRQNRQACVAVQSRFRNRATTATRPWEEAVEDAWATRTCGRRSPSTIRRGLDLSPVSARRATTGTAASGKGNNLFAESIVCLDAKNGAARVALPDHAPRSLGLRHAVAARAGDDSQGRPAAATSSRSRRSRDWCSCSIA